jgi:hypothetical protein
MQAKMRSWKVRWDGRGEMTGVRIISVSSYDLTSANNRAELLRSAQYANVEVFEVKPGTDEEIPD